jgi:hypothetical protein
MWDALSNLFWLWMAASFGAAGLLALVRYWRDAFRRAERDAVDFVSGASKPQPRNDDGRFDSPKARMTAQLRAELAHRRNGGV